jgi:hypothetical protein
MGEQFFNVSVILFIRSVFIRQIFLYRTNTYFYPVSDLSNVWVFIFLLFLRSIKWMRHSYFTLSQIYQMDESIHILPCLRSMYQMDESIHIFTLSQIYQMHEHSYYYSVADLSNRWEYSYPYSFSYLTNGWEHSYFYLVSNLSNWLKAFIFLQCLRSIIFLFFLIFNKWMRAFIFLPYLRSIKWAFCPVPHVLNV